MPAVNAFKSDVDNEIRDQIKRNRADLRRWLDSAGSDYLDRALGVATADANVGVVRLALECGANPNFKCPEFVRGRWGVSAYEELPLILAVKQRNVELTEILLKGGANPNVSNRRTGLTAMQYAMLIESAESIAALCASGVDIICDDAAKKEWRHNAHAHSLHMPKLMVSLFGQCSRGMRDHSMLRHIYQTVLPFFADMPHQLERLIVAHKAIDFSASHFAALKKQYQAVLACVKNKVMLPSFEQSAARIVLRQLRMKRMPAILHALLQNEEPQASSATTPALSEQGLLELLCLRAYNTKPQQAAQQVSSVSAQPATATTRISGAGAGAGAGAVY